MMSKLSSIHPSEAADNARRACGLPSLNQPNNPAAGVWDDSGRLTTFIWILSAWRQIEDSSCSFQKRFVHHSTFEVDRTTSVGLCGLVSLNEAAAALDLLIGRRKHLVRN